MSNYCYPEYEDIEGQPYIECSHCGRPLYKETVDLEGDEAWHIGEEWYCQECAEKEFRRVVT